MLASVNVHLGERRVSPHTKTTRTSKAVAASHIRVGHLHQAKDSICTVSQSWREVVFAMLLLFVGAVSVHDAALVVLLEDMIGDFERNPVGCWLIESAQGSVWPFLITKLFGTAIVGAAQVTIYQWRPLLALTITTALACFQFGLLLYLSLG